MSRSLRVITTHRIPPLVPAGAPSMPYPPAQLPDKVYNFAKAGYWWDTLFTRTSGVDFKYRLNDDTLWFALFLIATNNNPEVRALRSWSCWT